MPPADEAEFAALLQALDAELAHHLQEGVARVTGKVVGTPDQAIRDQGSELLQDIEGGIAADLPHSIERAAAIEDRHPPQEHLRWRIEQSVAPGDGVTQALLPLRRAERAAARQRQAMFELR